MPTPLTPYPSLVPVGRTARRVEWGHLPPSVRRAVEDRLRSTVVTADSRTSGFTPGFASVLTTEDGGRAFVKAASTKAQRMFAEAYREESRKLEALPAEAPAARLLWTLDVDDWFVLGLEHVESRQPRRPWNRADLDASLDALEVVADLLTPAPPTLALDPIEPSSRGSPATGTTCAPPDRTCRSSRRPRRSPTATARWSAARRSSTRTCATTTS